MKFHPPNRQFTLLYRRFLYRLAGKGVLLLTTRGRKTGNPHTIGLQYEFINGCYYVGSAAGDRSDWYRNLLADPCVTVEVGAHHFKAKAEPVIDPERIAAFLEFRLKKRPLMIRLILSMDGLKGRLDHEALLDYARKIRLIILKPLQSQ